MAVDIAVMRIEDYDEVVELWGRTDGVVLTETDSPQWIARYLERNPGMSFVAREEGRVVGAVLSGHDGRRGYLTHLAVDASCRRRGIGRCLVLCCIDALCREGLPACNLFVLNSNTAGRRFWESLGWALPDYWSVMNRRLD